MSARKAPPAIVQSVMVSLCTDIYRDETVRWRVIPWLASGYQVGSRSAHGILDNVRQERGQKQTDGDAENGDV